MFDVFCFVSLLTYYLYLFTSDLMAMKEESEELDEKQEKDHHDFTTGEKLFSCSQTVKTSSAKKNKTICDFSCQQCGRSK